MKQKVKITAEQIAVALINAGPPYGGAFGINSKILLPNFPDTIEIEVEVPMIGYIKESQDNTSEGWEVPEQAVTTGHPLADKETQNEIMNRLINNFKKKSEEETISEKAERFAKEDFEKCRPYLDKAFAPIKDKLDRITALEDRVDMIVEGYRREHVSLRERIEKLEKHHHDIPLFIGGGCAETSDPKYPRQP
jgi:hypothetical protein